MTEFKYTPETKLLAEARFWSYVDRSAGPDGCWLWTRSTAGTKMKYGAATWEGKHHLAHRIAYELTIGPIPPGLCCLHRCDVPRCCNPKHLWIGSKRDNNADKQEKKRQARGPEQSARLRNVYQLHPELHAKKTQPCKLTPEHAAEIRFLYFEVGLSQRTIGRFYAISQSGVSDICQGIRYPAAA